jgi:sigma-B regulation protein RsbU (phosphoserine phosphatase)
MTAGPDGSGGGGAPWEQRLVAIVETMREMSRQTDPQAMVRDYYARMRQIIAADRFLALSRRDLAPPRYRITRSSTWPQEINPWKERGRLPVLEGGLLGELLYGDEPRIIEELDVAAGDPGAAYLTGQRSLVALPNYDQGVALNMVVLMRAGPAAFDHEQLPELVWTSNLFGRAAQTLSLADELRRAYDLVEREMRVVADIQRSLLPGALPRIPALDLAVHYQTSRWAGGDYYDFFPLPDGRWGILIADVSGHGTPAAVLMAITHSLVHGYPGPWDAPGALLDHVNRQLATRYTSDNETFVTAFYGVYDPARRELTYANAGHNPPRLKRCEDARVFALDGAGGLPLGLFADQVYGQAGQELRPGDQVVFYTDGITEATDPAGRMFGVDRLDASLELCHLAAAGLIAAVLEALEGFTASQPAGDDRTLLVAKVT